MHNHSFNSNVLEATFVASPGSRCCAADAGLIKIEPCTADMPEHSVPTVDSARCYQYAQDTRIIQNQYCQAITASWTIIFCLSVHNPSAHSLWLHNPAKNQGHQHVKCLVAPHTVLQCSGLATLPEVSTIVDTLTLQPS